MEKSWQNVAVLGHAAVVQEHMTHALRFAALARFNERLVVITHLAVAHMPTISERTSAVVELFNARLDINHTAVEREAMI